VNLFHEKFGILDIMASFDFSFRGHPFMTSIRSARGSSSGGRWGGGQVHADVHTENFEIYDLRVKI